MEYTFKHALTHDVAYGSVLHDRRRLLHAAIVQGIERLYPERLVDHIDKLAHHAYQGEMWGKAVELLRQAGAKAVARSAPAEAVNFFELALRSVERIPESQDNIAQAIDLRIDLQSALGPLGATERMLKALQEAEALAEGLADHGRRGRVFAHMCYTFLWMGAADRAVESGKRALEVASSLQDHLSLEVVTKCRLGQAYYALGEYRQAIDVLKQTIEPLQGVLIRERFGLPVLPSAISRSWTAVCLANLGEFPAALAIAEDGLRIAEVADHHYSIVNSCWGLAHFIPELVKFEVMDGDVAVGLA